MAASMRVVAVANGKGGVGKTSTTTHVGALAAEAGNRVLLIELDSQGNMGEDLGLSGAGLGDDGEGLYDAVRKDAPLVPLKDVRPGLDVIPGGQAVSLIAGALDAHRRAGRPSTGAVARALAPVAAGYDFVLIDTPPIDAVLQEEALIAAKYLLIPTKSDASSRKGLREIARRFAAARQINPELVLLGVFLFGVTAGATLVVSGERAGTLRGPGSRVRTAARTTIEAELGPSARVFDATIRHVESAAFDIRERGQLAHELERDAAAGPSWWERRRSGAAAGPTLAASSGNLAGDYAALTTETLNEILRLEATRPEAAA